MKETDPFKPGFALTIRLVFALLFFGIVQASTAMKPLAPKGDGAVDETKEGDPKRQKIDFVSLQADVQEAVDESSAHKLLALYEQVKATDFSPHRWKEEWGDYAQRTQRKNAVLWNAEDPEVYRTNLWGILFLEAAVNEPHMLMLKNVLLPLKDASDELWEEVYQSCLVRISKLVKRHHYYRRTGGLYGLIAASGFKNPIASLIFLGAFRSVWEDVINPEKYPPWVTLSEQTQVWFEKSHTKVSQCLKDQKDTLRLFLSNADPRYVDVDEEIFEKSRYRVDLESEEKELRAIIDEKRRLGLPCYSILYAHSIGAHRRDDTSVEMLLGKIACYSEALERGDPRGGYEYASVVHGHFEELPEAVRKPAFSKRMASIRLGDPEAIAAWKNGLWVWKTHKEKRWAKTIVKTHAINYERMRQFFERVLQGVE